MQAPFNPEYVRVDTITDLFHGGIEASVLRLDQLHPVISGNKWFKLRYYLEEAKTLDKKNIVTFGGAWSNHIVATAAACHFNGLNSTGIIRGEEPAGLSATLRQAREFGMQLIFTPRTEYSARQLPAALNSANNFIIPEGGYGAAGARGAATILQYVHSTYTHYCCAAGTGTMTAGLVNAVNDEQQVIAISVLKNNRSLEEQIKSLVIPSEKQVNWQLLHDYHFGGYAKYELRLLEFMNDFYSKSGIPSDFVYTGKLFYAVNDLIEKKFFPPGSRLLIIHSGGLQGNASLGKGTLMF